MPVRAALCSAAMVLLALAACEDPLALPPPRNANTVETVSLWALSATALQLPSAYSIERNTTVRPDQDPTFDIAFDIDAQGQALLLPTGAIGLGRASGIIVMPAAFSSVTLAPGEGYQDSLAVVVVPDLVAVMESRLTTCLYGIPAAYYAKVRVLAIDPVDRRLDLELLANTNCGYRGLQPGLPQQ